jgi:ParB family transcriptional regulator, chromosome partitioning protein
MFQITSLPLEQLIEAPWSPNQMDEAALARLRRSISQFSLVQNLVVRPAGPDLYEVLSGNQRLKILREIGVSPVPCCVVEVDNARARLLAQALNRLHGEDNLGSKAELVRDLFNTLSEEEMLSILPDSRIELRGLANLGKETLSSYLQTWDQVRSCRLRNLQFRLPQEQLDIVMKALYKYIPAAHSLHSSNPNLRGKALFLLCKEYLERRDHE